MNVAFPPQLFSVAEYLALERAAEERHEYLDGRILDKPSDNWEHGGISVNLVASVGLQLKNGPFRARTKATKVYSGPTQSAGKTTRCLFSYPDVVVICDEPQYLDKARDVVLNPKVIMEVHSESTEAFDRGEKFLRYLTWNESLTDYLLISQDKPQIEHYTRQPDGAWTFRLTTGMEASVALASIDCTLRMADVYDRVKFPDAEPEN